MTKRPGRARWRGAQPRTHWRTTGRRPARHAAPIGRARRAPRRWARLRGSESDPSRRLPATDRCSLRAARVPAGPTEFGHRRACPPPRPAVARGRADRARSWRPAAGHQRLDGQGAATRSAPGRRPTSSMPSRRARTRSCVTMATAESTLPRSTKRAIPTSPRARARA